MVRRKADDEMATDGDQPRIMLADEPGKKIKSERIQLPLNQDGSIDWEHTRQQSKDKLAAALSSNPDSFRNFGVGKLEAAAGSIAQGPITAEHFGALLFIYEMAEQKIVPAYLYRQSQGEVKITPEIAARAFKFTSEQREKICPLGAQVLNEKLPDWLKAWIAKAGPVSELLGLLGAATWMQTLAAVEMWKATRANIEGVATDVVPPAPAPGVM